MIKHNNITALAHRSAINRVIDHVENNLYDKIELADLAQVANLSKYHFLRVFKTLTGETPLQFTSRLRLEKAAALLISKPQESISNISGECGFTDMTVFSKNFKKQFGISATEWRENKSNQDKVISNQGRLYSTPSMYFCQKSNTIKWRPSVVSSLKWRVRRL